MTAHKVPVRTCIACRTSEDKRMLLRIVRTSAGVISVDPSGRLPGRGAYLCPSKECLAKVVKEKKLARALRAEIPEETIRELEVKFDRGSDDM